MSVYKAYHLLNLVAFTTGYKLFTAIVLLSFPNFPKKQFKQRCENKGHPRFIRVCTEICVEGEPISVESQPDTMAIKKRYQVYSQIDAFVRLVCLLIKHSGDTQNPGIRLSYQIINIKYSGPVKASKLAFYKGHH